MTNGFLGKFGRLVPPHPALSPRWRGRQQATRYWRSYSPLPSRLRTVNPAFLASLTEGGLVLIGELNVEMILRTGRLQAGQGVSSGALTGRRSGNVPPQTMQAPSDISYS